jgi:hypothetical protein
MVDHPRPELYPSSPVVVVAASQTWFTTDTGGTDMSEEFLCISRDGGAWWVDSDRVTFKFPPDGPYRLLFGWADKGQA